MNKYPIKQLATTIDMEQKDLISQTISFLRFPLIIGVILIHADLSTITIAGNKCYINNIDYPIYTQISYFFSQIISRVAVPLFFFISGFLFFYKTQIFNSNIYLQKIKKRIHTIVIPYLIWNLLVILYHLCAQLIVPELLSTKNKPICDFSISDWVFAFWNTYPIYHDSNLPINFPLWFIRDLIIVIIFSPLLYLAIQKLSKTIVIALGLFWFSNIWFKIPGFSVDAFFFFTFGAYFSIKKKNFINLMKPLSKLCTILYLIIIVIELLNNQFSFIKDYIEYIHKLGILLGIISVITISAHFISKGKWKTNSFLAKSTFFLYAYHSIPLGIIIKLSLMYIKPYTEFSLLIIYFGSTIIITIIGLMIYHLIKTYFPRFTAFITGGR